jgi:double-stranded uracil-DNA glycosylase
MSLLRHTSFAPIWAENCQLLILGSLPGAKSLAAGEYYAHPQNQFWRLLDDVLRLRLSSSNYINRIEILLENGVALWDVIQSAQRSSSLDSDIKDAAPQDLRALLPSLPALKAIAFNGGKASMLGRRILNEGGDWLRHRDSTLPSPIRLIDLPSSSAANTQSFDHKAAAWSALAPYALPA